MLSPRGSWQAYLQRTEQVKTTASPTCLLGMLQTEAKKSGHMPDLRLSKNFVFPTIYVWISPNMDEKKFLYRNFFSLKV